MFLNKHHMPCSADSSADVVVDDGAHRQENEGSEDRQLDPSKRQQRGQIKLGCQSSGLKQRAAVDEIAKKNKKNKML